MRKEKAVNIKTSVVPKVKLDKQCTHLTDEVFYQYCMVVYDVVDNELYNAMFIEMEDQIDQLCTIGYYLQGDGESYFIRQDRVNHCLTQGTLVILGTLQNEREPKVLF